MAIQRYDEQELEIDAAGVSAGMNVFARDGQKLGIVKDMWAYIPPYGNLPKSGFALADYGPIRGTMHLFEGADGYIQVAPRHGIRRDGEQDLFIPLGAIHDAVPGQSVVVADTGAACATRYTGRPACL